MIPPYFRFFRPRFRPGRVFVTLTALEVLRNGRISPVELLLRHVSGDWGDLSESDCQQNELSLEAGLRLLSSYALPTGEDVWIITEWDRSSTTILVSGEF
ncbi:hypothetical protein [Burkholderia pseudomallei]|uniref:hypothetical protein n=1 Tax=Burkholderia pseudomallei TaxID=28450 RepID=UPI000F0820C9|nr:hypothetical protein [Burkholderia pseudomallei]VCJ27960.1 plasmid related protein [Burkholderia pseudomallei]VCJ28952.1 plasmid related protein [Burkholderia pseudomallei]